jgi:hypothetical protein
MAIIASLSSLARLGEDHFERGSHDDEVVEPALIQAR